MQPARKMQHVLIVASASRANHKTQGTKINTITAKANIITQTKIDQRNGVKKLCFRKTHHYQGPIIYVMFHSVVIHGRQACICIIGLFRRLLPADGQNWFSALIAWLAVSVRLSHMAVALSSRPRFCRMIEMLTVASGHAKFLSK